MWGRAGGQGGGGGLLSTIATGCKAGTQGLPAVPQAPEPWPSKDLDQVI